LFTSILSDFVARSAYGDLAEADIAFAKRGVLDFLAVSFAGDGEQVVAIAQARTLHTRAHEEATVINGGFKTDAHLAAYANGIRGHALDYDDVIHAPGLWMGHPTTVILPAVLALSEKQGLGGRDLILAYCLGVEIYAKVGVFCGDRAYKNGWHNTAFIGTMAAAGAAARLLGLDAAQVRRCFGIAGSHAGGLRQNFGTMMKPVHAGLAGRNGIESALLAQAGVTADEDIFEAELGFRNTFSGVREDLVTSIPYGAERITSEEFAARLGKPWAISGLGLIFKLCPSCRGTHFAMDAAVELKAAHGVGPGQIAEVEAHVPAPLGSVLFHHDPQTGLEGKFSLEYVLARSLLGGVPGIGDFTDARVQDPEVRAMMKKIKWISYEPADGQVFGAPDFLFKLTDGRQIPLKIEFPRGEPENPLEDAALVEKFHDCAGTVMDAGRRNAIADAVLRLDSLSTVAELANLL
jgi:2-methylcitrate dehydratase PrpD